MNANITPALSRRIEGKIAYRAADGSGNNKFDATLNAAGTEFGRIGEAHFADGISEPLGGNNPRTISNLVVGAGDAGVANPEGVSAFMYAWGQFIDHDMTLTRSDNVNRIDIVIPDGDPILPEMSIARCQRVQSGDVLLVCTDGFWANLSEEDILASLFSGAPLRDSLQALADSAVRRGGAGSDNTSAAVLRLID